MSPSGDPHLRVSAFPGPSWEQINSQSTWMMAPRVAGGGGAAVQRWNPCSPSMLCDTRGLPKSPSPGLLTWQTNLGIYVHWRCRGDEGAGVPPSTRHGQAVLLLGRLSAAQPQSPHLKMRGMISNTLHCLSLFSLIPYLHPLPRLGRQGR